MQRIQATNWWRQDFSALFSILSCCSAKERGRADFGQPHTKQGTVCCFLGANHHFTKVTQQIRDRGKIQKDKMTFGDMVFGKKIETFLRAEKI